MNERSKDKPLAVETEHLSPYEPHQGNTETGTLRERWAIVFTLDFACGGSERCVKEGT
jgi:hypothetical protein